MSTRSPTFFISNLSIYCTVALFSLSAGHMVMSKPRQRGSYSQCPIGLHCPSIKSGLEIDWFGHFPAGDKRQNPPGAAYASQIRAGVSWEPYDPMNNPSLRFRAGVCGDMPDSSDNPKGDHLRLGKYYYPPERISKLPTYKQGGILKMEVYAVAHHNGYIEAILCDVAKRPCNGEISERCLKSSSCRKLRRAPSSCDTSQRHDCAPIDPNNPTRWHFPCSSTRDPELFDNIKFLLPNDVNCDHCVVQMYHATANHCNPPEIYQYYRGPEGPRWWGDCPGEAGAKGGYNYWTQCGGKNFPEEYYKCSDIRITPRNAGREPSYPPNNQPNPVSVIRVSRRLRNTNGKYKTIIDLKDQERMFNYFQGKDMELQIEAIVSGTVKSVHLWVEEADDLYTSTSAPYAFSGFGFKKGSTYPLISNRWFTVQVTAKTMDGYNHYTEAKMYITP